MHSEDERDRLAPLRRRIAYEHLGDPELGEFLRGGNSRQLRDSAEALRAAFGRPDTGERFSPEAALFACLQARGQVLADSS